jgi:hypothetical protein
MSDDPSFRGPSPEQLRYACILDIGMKTSLVLLILSFGAYVCEAFPVRMPFEDLPRLWTLPVGDYLRQSGMPTGWNWLAMLENGDVLALSGIALLAGISMPSLLVLLPSYAGRRDWAFFSMTCFLVGVLVLAASGIFVSH